MFSLAAGNVWADDCTPSMGLACAPSGGSAAAVTVHAAIRTIPSGPVSCSPVGKWTSSGGFGASIMIQSNLTGTFTPSYCPHPFPLVVAVQGNALSVVARWTGDAICISFSESLSFAADCQSASGAYTNADGESGPDTWTRVGGNLSIISPANQSESIIPTAVTFQADPGPGNSDVIISWTNTLEYQTSGGRGAYSEADAITTIDKGVNAKSYGYVGGKLTAKVSAIINGSPQSAGPNTAYLMGFAIPNATITSQLVSAYSGTTTHLLTGIAMKESTYRQFARRTLYGHTGLWPNESYDGGSHIGLMQMPTTKAYAWDWIVNTQDAATLFSAKVASAQRKENAIITAHSGLRVLTGTERENMALVLYGPYASHNLSKQYYAPVKDANGMWVWAVNTAGNPNGVTYANDVRNKIQ